MYTDKLISSKEDEIRGLLTNERHYAVPPFQREYSWTIENIEEFMSDLIKHMNGDHMQHYFFGTIFVCENDSDNDEMIVLDGQQRLATSIIFLSVIRDIFKELKDDVKIKKINDWLYYDIDHLKSRLKLNQRNNKFFQETILSNNLPTEKISSFVTDYPNKEIIDAYKKIYKILIEEMKYTGNTTIEEKTNYLFKMMMHFLKYFILIINTVKSIEEKNKIFNSVNNKGQRLSENDFVKNAIFEMVNNTHENEDICHNKWLQMLNNLENFNMNQNKFLRNYLLAYHKKTLKKNVSKTIIEQIGPNLNTPTELINKLYDASQQYWYLMEPGIKFQNNDIIMKNLGTLKILNSQSVYPALLIGYDKLGNSLSFEKLTNLMLKFFFRTRTICHREANSIEKIIEKVCIAIKNDTPLSEICDLLKESTIYPSQTDFISNFNSFKTNNNTLSLYILSTINDELSEKKSSNNLLVEYIIPEHLSDNWSKYLKNGMNIYSNMELIIQHHDMLYKIGNMTLISKPNKNCDDLFPEKLNNVYLNSDLQISKLLGKYTTWFNSDIINYQTELAKIAESIWDVNDN